jgi:hypothetical protein
MGTYTGKIVKPLAKIKQKPNTPVIITFLDHDEDGMAQFAAARGKYRDLAKHFDFGETPDEDYAKEMMAEYFSSLPKM